MLQLALNILLLLLNAQTLDLLSTWCPKSSLGGC
jgi:hypothetical protein